MIDLRLVEAFVLLVDAGSLSRAEMVSGVPKATLSRQLIRLEAEMGVPLLRRGERRLELTEAGRSFLVHARSLAAEMTARIDAARTEMHDLTDGLSGQISILSDNLFGTSFMCRVMHLFLERFPNVRCQFDLAGKEAPEGLGEADCYVGMQSPAHPNLISRSLGRLSLGLFASPDYLADFGTPGSEWDLVHHRAIVFTGSAARNLHRLHSASGKFDYRPDSPVRTDDYWIMKTFCTDGLGIGLMPDFFCKPEVEAGTLVPLLPAWRPEPMRVYCSYQRQRFTGRKVRALIDLVGESFKSIDSFHYYVAARELVRQGAAS